MERRAALLREVRRLAREALPAEASRVNTMRSEIRRQRSDARRLDDLTVEELTAIREHLVEMIRRLRGRTA